MAVPLAIMAVGAGLSIYGNIKANKDQAGAIRQNLLWMQHQQAFMDRAFEREERLFKNQAEATVGTQATIAGASGLEMSGSVLDVMQSTYAAAEDEIAAMRDNASMQRMQMQFNMKQKKTEADRLSSFSYNALQSATIGANAYAGMYPHMGGGGGAGVKSMGGGAPSMAGGTQRGPASYMTK